MVHGRWMVALGLGLGLGALEASAIELTLEPASAVVNSGSGMDVAIVIRGLGSGVAPSLGAFDLNVSYDVGILAFTSVTWGDPILGNQLGLILGSADGLALNAAAGVVNLFSISLESTLDLETFQADAFTLGSLHFAALSPGVSSLTLSDVILGDAIGDALVADAIGGGSVRVVSTVPEGGMHYPGAFLVAMSAGCAWVRRGRRLAGDSAGH